MQPYLDLFTFFSSLPPMKMAKIYFYLVVITGSLGLFAEWVEFRIAKAREAEDM